MRNTTDPTCLAHEVVDLRSILRFERYTHAVPLAPLEEMELDPCTDEDSDSLGMLWLRPKRNYPVYFRKGGYDRYKWRQGLRRKEVEMVSDGTPNDHVVAVEVLKPDARADYGRFHRATWWVKSYDAYHGYRVARDGGWYGRSTPGYCDHHPSEAFSLPWQKMGFDRGALRPWDGSKPVTRKLDWGRVPEWNHAPLAKEYPYWKRIGSGTFHLIARHGQRSRADYAVQCIDAASWMALRWRNPHDTLGRGFSSLLDAKQACEADYQEGKGSR